MRTQTALVLLVALGSAAVAGCSSSSSTPDGAIGRVRASLHRAKSCPDLLADLKLDAKTKLDRAVDRAVADVQKCVAKHGEKQCGYGGYLGGPSYRGGAEFDAAENSAVGGAAPPSAAPSPSAASYSETNTQVKGVDEADFVKNDGQNLYVLHGRTFKIVKAWPATEIADLASIDIEGTPSEMFVDGGRAVVYSTVDGTKLFQAAGVTPKQSYRDYAYYPAGGGWSGAGREAAVAPMPDGSGGYGAIVSPLTKITVLDLTSGTPAVTREVYFEGQYQTSRRVGTHVRTVLGGAAHGPKLAYSTYDLAVANGVAPERVHEAEPKTASEVIAKLEELRAHNHAKIDATQIGDWLPYTFVKNGGAVTARTVECHDFYVPTAGSTESGITEVASIDLANPGAEPRETAILGRADTVYANASTMVLAARGWVEPPNVNWDEGGSDGSVSVGGTPGAAPPPDSVDPAPATSPAPAPAPAENGLRPQNVPTVTGIVRTFATNETHLHTLEFESDPTFPNYVASGTVPGSVKNQFSIEETGGFVRVATTENRFYLDENDRYLSPTANEASARPSTVNHLFVLGASPTEAGVLDTVGSTGDLAPNEQIYSVRYVGNRGYVVTFRQVDPLFVVDLAQPTQPTVLAALKIPGFSEYMHPLDETHLLTIGRDADENGRVRGLQLQIFDVTDGSNPVLTHKHTYDGSEYGHSEAQYDHKAFTYFADKKLLAFPYYSYTSSGMRSSLELFRVETATGFGKVGSVDHSALLQNNPQGFCGGYYQPQVRRGVFLEDFVYSVSYAGVVVRDSRNVNAPISELTLPAPQVNEGYGPAACY